MRWALFWHENPDKRPDDFESYGFKTDKKAPFSPKLRAFEEDLIGLIAEIETRPVNCDLQKRMKRDLEFIRSLSDKIVVASDKTSNFYIMDVAEYMRNVEKELMAKYKKADTDIIGDIDSEAATIAISLKLADRIEGMAPKQSFITIKDHKEDFPTRVSYRLLTPAKTNIGVISKSILDRVNGVVKEFLEVNLWKSTKEALSWFNGVEEKENYCWIKFDIESYFPSISKDLLLRTLSFLRSITYISDFEIDLILHCRRGVSVGTDNCVWVKSAEEDFDVTMGSHDSAEVSEAVGLYLLHKISTIIPKDKCGLYRDDGLGLIQGGKQEVERVKKKLYAAFREEDLQITAEGGGKTVDFLDVILDLQNGKHHPYVKPNTTTHYVSTQSNHPKKVLDTIPVGVAKRLSNNSSSKQDFDEHTAHFKDALKSAGYEDDIQYIPEEGGRRKRRLRKKRPIYFNPPWGLNIKTRVVERFLTLVRKHFGKTSPLHHLFGPHILKASYSTLPNMKMLISSHNKKVLGQASGTRSPELVRCDCDPCELDGQCLLGPLVYKADVEVNGKVDTYIGQTKNTFKMRVSQHNSNVRTGRKATRYSTFVLEKKKEGLQPKVTWNKVSLVPRRKKGDRFCPLCISEKTFITRAKDDLINSRNEIMNRCRHKEDLVLRNNLNRSRKLRSYKEEIEAIT